MDAVAKILARYLLRGTLNSVVNRFVKTKEQERKVFRALVVFALVFFTIIVVYIVIMVHNATKVNYGS